MTDQAPCEKPFSLEAIDTQKINRPRLLDFQNKLLGFMSHLANDRISVAVERGFFQKDWSLKYAVRGFM